MPAMLSASSSHGPLIFLAVTALLALGLLFVGFRALKRKRLIENVPTSKVKGVFLGLNEVKGNVECDAPLASYLAGVACVHYAYGIQEHYSRTVTTTDSKGRTQTRTESGWRTVDSGGGECAFDLRDSTGALRVRPQGAEVSGDRVFSRTCGRLDPLYYGKGPSGSIMDSTHRRRFTEHAVPVDARVYVMGPARLREDKVEPEIAHEKDAELFLISTKSEEQITRGYGLGSFFALLVGTLAAWAFPVGFVLGDVRDFGTALGLQVPVSAAFAGGYAGLVGLYYLVLVYNGLVSVKQRMEMARSMIEVQLRRRHDLIPRLVACVKGYASHERETQERLAALRTSGATAEEQAERQGGALRTIFALAESYPDLKADGNFLALQRELVDTEDRIALAREFYNGSVRALEDRIATLPDVLVAKLTGFKSGEMFAAKGFEKVVPRVET